MKDSLITCLVMLSLVFVIVVFSLIPDDQKNEDGYYQYAVLFPFGQEPTYVFEKIINAGGLPIRNSAFDSLIISASRDPDYSSKLYQQGAVFVFNTAIKGGCVITRKTVL